jgi:hypothetical protein
MLLGYDNEGEIKFIFTDELYLEKKFPNNSAKISNFWGNREHGLTEFFVSVNVFNDTDNLKHYKIVEGRLTKKTEEEINNTRKNLRIEPGALVVDNLKKNNNITITNKTVTIKGNN